MTEPAAVGAVSGPYRAYQSYGPADGDLFFGRETEGVVLARWFQDHNFAVLTAPSGIGKTSLLNARVIPLLEQQRWAAVYCRPNEDPLVSLAIALCEYLFPSPEEEAAVASRLLAAIGEDSVDLQGAIDWFKVLPLDKRVDSRLFAPRNAKDSAALPVLSRALRGSLSCGDVIEHFEALVAEGKPLGLTGQTRLADVAALLGQGETLRLQRLWLDRFAKSTDAAAILRLLDDEWLPLKPGTAGVFLIVDQFEEVFTRLPAATIDRFMDEVGKVISARSGSVSKPHSKPVHIAVSLRKEFFADLVPRLRKLGVRDVTHFLEPMTLAASRLAVARPTALFGMDFEPATVDRILSYALDDGALSREEAEAVEADLPREARYSPALISLIGSHLWKVLPPPGEGRPLQVKPGDLPRLGSVFASYLKDALGKIGQASASPFDALELLDRLVTGSGFRNIVPQDELVRRWPLKKDGAERLLNLLDGDVKLIRRERRHGGLMVEIMHERLIPPVRSTLAELRRKDPLRSILPSAYDMLAIAPDDAFVTTNPMPTDFRDALLRYLDQCDLDPLRAKTLLRSVVAAGPGGPQLGDNQMPWHEAVRHLARAIMAAGPSDIRHAALPVGSRLDETLDELYTGEGADNDYFRRIALGALSDMSPHASRRVARAFGYLATRQTAS